MDNEIWLEQVKARLAEARERFVDSIVRNAYTDSEPLLYIQEKNKTCIEILEDLLTQECIERLIGLGEEYEILKAELNLTETEMQLTREEFKLYDKTFNTDWSMNRQDNLISRFLAEDALRLSEAEVRVTEAEVRLAEDDLARRELDHFYDGYNEAARYLSDHDMWINSLDMWELEVVIPDEYYKMQELADYYYMRGLADLDVAIATTKLQIAELKVRLVKEEFCVAKSKLILAELDANEEFCVAKSKLILAELETNNIEAKKPNQLMR